MGAGIYDRLVEHSYGGAFGSGKLNAINFGSKPIEPPPLDDSGKASGEPLNCRAEMEGPGFSLPDSDSLQADICGPGYRYMSDGRLVLQSKDEMRSAECRARR